MLEVTTSVHNMPCIEIRNPTSVVRDIVRGAILCNLMDDKRYILHKKAGAFLQGDEEDWMLVEFWTKDYQPFVDYLNELLEK